MPNIKSAKKRVKVINTKTMRTQALCRQQPGAAPHGVGFRGG